METVITILFWVLLILVTVPTLSFFTVKFGTYAFYKARNLAHKHKK
jgi:hypothetical protein